MPLTDEPVLPGVPREMLPKRSPEYALRTLQHIQSLSLTAKYTLLDLERALDEAREARIHEVYPASSGQRFATLDDLIKHELGETVAEIRARKRSQAAALATAIEDVPKKNGERNDLTKLVRLPRDERSAVNGVSRAQQKKIDKLAREAPDLLREVREGRLSVNAAFIAAGFAVGAFSISRDPEKAAASIRKQYTPEQIAILVDCLTGRP